jgi:hypothetical protein
MTQGGGGNGAASGATGDGDVLALFARVGEAGAVAAGADAPMTRALQ